MYKAKVDYSLTRALRKQGFGGTPYFLKVSKVAGATSPYFLNFEEELAPKLSYFNMNL